MKQRIAVAIDFSSSSEHALKEAIAVARRIGAEVHMIHVCEGCEDDGEDAKALNRALRDEAHERLAELRARQGGQGAQLFQTILDGEAADSLCLAAAELDCQMIVTATHGHTGLRRLFLGSVAEKVTRLATMDVLVSRGTRPKNGYHRILVPTDFSLPAERALQRAVAIAAPGADIDLFHVWQFPGPVTMQYAAASSHQAAVKRIGRRIQEEAVVRAQPILDQYSSTDVSIQFTAINGSEGPAIVDRAVGCDLVVLGTHGRRGFQRFVLGSIAERTIRHAPCSVLAVHAAQSDD